MDCARARVHGHRVCVLQDANVSFGDLYLFERHLCFDWKVFGFHKQQVVPLTDVVALLKSAEVANTVEVQGKGYSLELTLPENFDDVWTAMEACRRVATAAALQQASAEMPAQRPGQVEEVDAAVLDALTEGNRATSRAEGRRESGMGPGTVISMDLTESDWSLFLSGAKQMRFRKGTGSRARATRTRAPTLRGSSPPSQCQRIRCALGAPLRERRSPRVLLPPQGTTC